MRTKLWKRLTAAACIGAMLVTGINVNMPVLTAEAASSSWVWDPYYSESGYEKVPFGVLSATADSQQTSGEGTSKLYGNAVHGKWDNVVDGAPTSFWHTRYNNGDGTAPTTSSGFLTGNNTLTITINEESGREVKGITILPRQDSYGNGALIQFDVKVSTDGSSWEDAANDVVISEHGSSDSWSGNKAEKEVIFTQTYSNVKYVKIIAERTGVSGSDNTLSGTGGHITAAEISILTPNYATYTRFNPTTTVGGQEVYVLEKNATANSEQAPVDGNDGTADWAFDGDDTHWWHSRWGNWGQVGSNDSNDVITQSQKDAMFTNGNVLWIGSGFDESIMLSKVTYQGRGNGQGLIGNYELWIANLDEPTATPNEGDFRKVKEGELINTNDEQAITLDTPLSATHFKLVVTSYATGAGGDAKCIAAKHIKVYSSTEIPTVELLKAGSIPASDETITDGQPFAAGTAGSNIFRIPCLITLDDGNILAAADARYTEYRDFGGIDTIASVSTDNGRTWKYSFPIYFPDSAGSTGQGQSTTAIDPAIVQAADGTIYCMADMNPTGVTTLDTYPLAGTGFVTINGVARLALTSNYSNASTLPTDADTTTFEYYVGDFDENGFAKVLNRADGSESGYGVDEWYNIYSVVNGNYVANLTQSQVNDSNTLIQQNAFYRDSVLHVYNTGYIWLVESNDGGLTWENPRILNSQLKRDNEAALLVSPGKGLVTSGGDIIIGCYNNLNGEDASFFYSTDNGESWNRTTGDVPNSGKESENEIIELPDGTLRMFYRTDTMKICYVDITKGQDGTYSFGTTQRIDDFQVSSNCNVSALLLEDTTIDGKPVVLVSLPSTPGAWNRNDGRIYVFTLNDDKSMKHEYTYEVNEGEFAYSCMTELDNGNIGILWEPGNNERSAIRYDEFDINEVIGKERNIHLLVGETYTEQVKEGVVTTRPTSTIASIKIESQTSWDEHQLYDHSGSWNNNGITASDMAAFNPTPNKELSLENAEFTFTGADNSWVIQNEATGKYLRQEKVNSSPAFLKDTETTMIVEKVEGDDTFYIYQLQSDDSYRSIIFYYTQMNFNANSGGPNPNYDTNAGDYKLSLLEKQASVSSDDILPGYKVAESITSGNKYLVCYIWERTTDAGAIERTVFVLYPGTDGTNNVTKLVNDSYVMYDHEGNASTFSATENRSINLKTAEYRFEGTVDNAGNFAGTIKTGTNGKYLTNYNNANTFFTDESYSDMTLTQKEDGTFGLKLTSPSRYILFHTDNTFNGQGGATNSTFVLLEKQDTVSATDVLPGYAKVTDIQSGHDYLISYIDSANNVYVLYPDNGTVDQTKLVKVANFTTTNLTITGVAPGTTTAVVDGVTYNITVTMDADDTSRDIPVEYLDVTAGCAQTGYDDSDKQGNPDFVKDNDVNSIWHTPWDADPGEGKLWIQFEVDGNYTVDGLRYLPRTGAGAGTIKGYEIWASNDAEFTEGNYEVVASGTWAVDGSWKLATFTDMTEAKYIRLVVTDSVAGTTDWSMATAAEIRLTGFSNEIEVTLSDIVVDFGLPVEYVFQSNEEITKGEATYGDVTVTSEEDGYLYNNTITYKPTSVLKAKDVITFTDSNDEEFTMNVYPATTVYYEEGFAEYDTTKAWTSTGAKGTAAQDLQSLEESSTGQYGYDSKYAAEVTGPSNNTEAVSNAADDNTAGQKATFTFTGTGVDVYANCGAETGSAAIVISGTDEGSTYKKLVIVDTAMAGEGENTTSSEHDGINAYNIPIVSVNDLTRGNYEVAITHVKNSYTDETTGELVQEAKPIKLDGFRVYNTLEDGSVYEVHNEADPNFIEMRNVVLNAIGVDVSAGDYAEDIAANLTQILDKNETMENASAVILDNGTQSADAQDRLDNGPKNELFLYSGQTLVFNLASGLKNVQVGMKAVNANVDVKVKKGNDYLLGGADAYTTITSSTDMFYVIGDITADTTITITNNGSGILSITDLKYFVEASTANVFKMIEESDLVPVLQSMGYDSKVLLNPFEDVKEVAYFFDAVLWAVKNRITDGWTETTFAPDMGCTRGQVVTFLWRAAGQPKATSAENPFVDVAENAYYYDAVLWAVENGITDGWTEDTFAPDMECTRGQIVTFIWRAAGEPEVPEISNPFVDVEENAYYYDAVLWAVENGITEGWLPTEFAPDMECVRGQIVTFLYRAK